MFDWLKAHRHPVKEADLSAYLDGELSPERKRQLEEHLRSCDGCSRKLDALRTLAAALREMPESPLPRSFTLTPEQARGIQKAKPSSTAARLYPAFRTAAAAAIVLLFAFVGADIFLQSGGGRDEPQATMMSAEKNVEMPATEGGAAADEEKSERQAFGENLATPSDTTGGFMPPGVPLPAPPGTPLPGAESTPLLVLSPVALGTPLPGTASTPLPDLALAAPETPPAPEAASPVAVAEEEKEEDRVWLRALEGVLGGLALGFLAVAFFVRVRSRRAGTPT